MKKQGFTLVEVMGVITLLGLLSVLIVPTVINQIRNSKKEVDEVTQNIIFSATDLYLENKSSKYPKINSNVYCIELQDLVDEGKLKEPIIDVNGNVVELTKQIKITVKKGNYSYQITNSCTQIN